MAPLPETAATRVDERVDASSTSAASVPSCSASQTDMRRARSTFSQSMRCAEKGEKSTVCLCMNWRSMAPLPEAASTRVDASSTSAASVCSCSTYNEPIVMLQCSTEWAPFSAPFVFSHFVFIGPPFKGRGPFSARPFLGALYSKLLHL